MIDDVFCKIISGEFKSETVYQDEDYLVIKDIHPQAPTHLLIVPKKHYADLNDFKESDAALLGRGFIVAEKVAKQLGLEKGYRLIINEGEHGGKLVPHLHIHLLGGKHLGPKIVRD
jgi:histidine triad (HIT) family protein